MKLELKQPGSVDHELIWGSIALLALVASFLPADRVLAATGYRCPFRAITGLPCPSCGAVRTFAAMGAFRFREAFATNPLMAAFWVGLLFYAPYGLCAALFGTRRLRVGSVRPWEKRCLLATLVCLVVLNWAYMISTHG